MKLTVFLGAGKRAENGKQKFRNSVLDSIEERTNVSIKRIVIHRGTRIWGRSNTRGRRAKIKNRGVGSEADV